MGLMLVVLCTLNACAEKISSPGTEPSGSPFFCSEARPIIFSRLKDTVETIQQIKAHNAVGVVLCGWSAQ